MSGGIKMNESIVKEISTNLNITENQVNVTLQMLSEEIPYLLSQDIEKIKQVALVKKK